MLIVFASNMDPKDLVDPAFLRRIQTKIHIGEVSDAQFLRDFSPGGFGKASRLNPAFQKT